MHVQAAAAAGAPGGARGGGDLPWARAAGAVSNPGPAAPQEGPALVHAQPGGGRHQVDFTYS